MAFSSALENDPVCAREVLVSLYDKPVRGSGNVKIHGPSMSSHVNHEAEA